MVTALAATAISAPTTMFMLAPQRV
jgi:hypothetical protein